MTADPPADGDTPDDGTHALLRAIEAMGVTYQAHGHAEAADRLRRAYEEVAAGTAVRAEVHALLDPRALPVGAVYPYDPRSRAAFYDAWDAALALTRDA